MLTILLLSLCLPIPSSYCHCQRVTAWHPPTVYMPPRVCRRASQDPSLVRPCPSLSLPSTAQPDSTLSQRVFSAGIGERPAGCQRQSLRTHCPPHLPNLTFDTHPRVFAPQTAIQSSGNRPLTSSLCPFSTQRRPSPIGRCSRRCRLPAAVFRAWVAKAFHRRSKGQGQGGSCSRASDGACEAVYGQYGHGIRNGRDGRSRGEKGDRGAGQGVQGQDG